MASTADSLDPTEGSPLLGHEPPEAVREDGADQDGKPTISYGRAACIMVFFTILIFLQAANFSVMSTASTEIAEDLRAYSGTSWFTSAYLIAMSSLSPLTGRLTQIFDPRNCALVSAVIFSAGVILASQATDFWTFVWGRAIQGAGAAVIYTLSVNLVLHLAGKKQRGLLIGSANSAITFGVSMGAVIGGAFVETIGWRPLFWIQAPVTIAASICLWFSIPSIKSIGANQDSGLREKLRSIDYIGSVLLVLMLTSFLIGLSNDEITMTPIFAALALLVLFILQELYWTSSPVIPLSVLSSRGVLLSCLTQLFFMTARWSVLFYTPIYTLAVRTWSPSTAGSILIPTNLGFAVGGMAAGALHIRRAGSFYIPTLACQALFPINVLILSHLVTATSSLPLFIAMVFLNGALAGAALNYVLAHLLHISAPETHFVATALVATARGFAGSFGSGIGGGLFTRTLHDRLTWRFASYDRTDEQTLHLITRLLGSPALVGQLSGIEHDVAVAAYSEAIASLFWAAAGLAVVSVALQAGTGWSSWEDRMQQTNPASAIAKRVQDWWQGKETGLVEDESSSG